jgi:hypothetical protein
MQRSFKGLSCYYNSDLDNDRIHSLLNTHKLDTNNIKKIYTEDYKRLDPK